MTKYVIWWNFFFFVLINKPCNLTDWFVLFYDIYGKVATVGQEQEGDFYTALLTL